MLFCKTFPLVFEHFCGEPRLICWIFQHPFYSSITFLQSLPLVIWKRPRMGCLYILNDYVFKKPWWTYPRCCCVQFAHHARNPETFEQWGEKHLNFQDRSVCYPNLCDCLNMKYLVFFRAINLHGNICCCSSIFPDARGYGYYVIVHVGWCVRKFPHLTFLKVR